MSVIDQAIIDQASSIIDDAHDQVIHEMECKKDKNYMFNHLAQKYIAAASNEYLYIMSMIKDITT